MKNPTWLIIMFVGAGLGACEEQVAISVNCETTWAPSIACDVTERLGKREVEACWDYTVTCANGNRVTAERTCQRVGGGETVRAVIPAAKLTGYDRCGGGGAPVGRASGLTLDGVRTE